jgi:hypothetical protein
MPGIASSGPHYVNNISIHSNTFLWLGLPAIWVGEKGIPVTNVNISNNIFFDSEIYILTDPVEISSDYNLFFDSPDPGPATPWGNECTTGNSICGQDPLFVNYARFVSWDVHLQDGSPAIDAGDPALASIFNLPSPFVDIDGTSRPQDIPGVGTEGPGAYDIGAYEFVEGIPALSPLAQVWNWVKGLLTQETGQAILTGNVVKDIYNKTKEVF